MKALTFVLLGKDHLTPVVNKAGKNIGSTSQQMSKSLRQTAVAWAAMAAVGAAASVKLAVDYSSAMQKIAGLVGVSQKQVNQWSQQILNLAVNLPQSPKELANAMYYVASAGFRGTQAMNVLTVAAKASAAGLGDTSVVVDAMASAMNSYAKYGLKASQVSDTLVAAVAAGKMPVEDLAQSIGSVLPVAAEMGVKFSEVAATAAALSHVGAPVEKTMTGLRYLLTSLEKPASASVKILKGLGLSVDDVRKSIKDRGLLPTLQELKNRLPTDAFLKVVGGARGVITALGLVGKNSAQTATVFKKVRDATGATDHAFNVASQTVGFKFKSALSGVQVAAIRLGAALLPTISKALDLFNKLIAPLTQNKTAFLAMTLGVFGFIAAFKVMTAAVIAGSMSMRAALITTGIGAALLLIGVGIAELALHWKTVWGGIKHVTGDVTGFIVRAATGVWDWLKTHWPLLLGILTGPLGLAVFAIHKYWGDITGVFQSGYRAVVGVINRIKGFVSSNFDKWWADNGEAIKKIWNVTWIFVKAQAKRIWDSIVFAAKGFWNVITTTFNIGKTIILGIWGAIWPIMKAVFQAAWVVIQYVVKAGWIIIKTAFEVGAATLTLLWKNTWEIIKLVFEQVWALIRTAVKIGWDIIVGLFSTFINIITGRWGAAWKSIRQMFQQVWNAMRSFLQGSLERMWRTIVATWSNVIHYFSTVPGKLLHAIGNLSNLLKNTGNQVIMGLFHGITGALSNVAGWVKRNIFDPVVGAIKHLFGIKSPSTVMAELGGHLIKGLILGLLKHDAAAFITKIFGSLPAALGSLVEKGILNLARLPGKALKALGGLGSKIGHFFGGLFGGGGGPSGDPSAIAAMRMAAGAHGWGSGAMWDAVNYVEMREAGYNIHAVNPSSGAYGMAQFINGPAEYYSYGGNPNTAWGQAVAMMNYFAQRYGNPMAAAAHERAFNWYAMGTNSAHPGWAVVGERGPEIVNFRGGEGVIPNSALGGHTYIINVEVKGHALASKAEIGRTVKEAVAYAERHGN